jgi:ABC-type proline/glycine betaine transport system permease subunit
MAPRSRLWAFGTAGVFVLAGGLCAALVGGLTGEVLTIVLISGGLSAALLLVFLDIGLGEERELEVEERRRMRRDLRSLELRRRRKLPQHPRRPR